MKLNLVKPFKALSIFALVGIMALANAAMANPFDDAQIQLQTIESGKKAIVKVWNLPASHSASLSVLNTDGKLVYKESFSSEAYSKKFDFSQLPAGKYKVLLQSGTQVQSKIFEVLEDGSINVTNDNRAVSDFKPFVKVREGNKVDLLVENRFSNTMHITIKNQKGEIAYQKEIAPQGKYANRLNLSYLPSDNYTLSVAGDGFEYAEDINVL